MTRLKLTPQDLSCLGYPVSGKARLVAIEIMMKHYRKADKAKTMLLLRDILINPLIYQSDAVLGQISQALRQDQSSHQY